jgi:hypothetical protein
VADRCPICDREGCPANEAKARTLALWDQLRKPRATGLLLSELTRTDRERALLRRNWKKAAAEWCKAGRDCDANAVDWRIRCCAAEAERDALKGEGDRLRGMVEAAYREGRDSAPQDWYLASPAQRDADRAWAGSEAFAEIAATEIRPGGTCGTASSAADPDYSGAMREASRFTGGAAGTVGPPMLVLTSMTRLQTASDGKTSPLNGGGGHGAVMRLAGADKLAPDPFGDAPFYRVGPAPACSDAADAPAADPLEVAADAAPLITVGIDRRCAYCGKPGAAYVTNDAIGIVAVCNEACADGLKGRPSPEPAKCDRCGGERRLCVGSALGGIPYYQPCPACKGGKVKP